MTRLFKLIISAAMISQVSAQSTATQTPPAAKQSPAQVAEAAYAKGKAAEKAGDPEAAKQAYMAALQANPKHANARYSLGEVKLHATEIAATGREAKFGAVMVPEFNLTDATLKEALTYLSKVVDKQSAGKVAANFVIQDPKNQLAETKINLQLKNMPARAIMKYLMDQSSAKARYDEFAIVVKPN